MKKLLTILGPTATGKTALAVKLARKFNGELVACDSRQVYKGLDIGTGKDGAKAWVYDVVSLRKQYTVYDYVKDAGKVISKIEKRDKLPILVGGTGFYLKALLEGLPNLGIPIDLKLRKELKKLTLADLQKKLSPTKFASLNYSDQHNPRRLIRAIEIARESRIQNLEFRIKKFNALKIGLTVPRQILYQRINNKVLEWMEEGIVGEVDGLIKSGISKERIKNLGLEYRVIIEYLNKKISKSQLIKQMQDKVRAYARRQITWFKKDSHIIWFDITDQNFGGKLEKVIAKWYYE